MIIGRFKKQPLEILQYTVDYDCWLADGESIVTLTIVSTTDDDGVGEPTLGVDPGDIVIAARGVTFLVAGGTDGVEYKLTLTMSSDGNQVTENEIFYAVEEI
jgi:hypothetical protein